MTTVEIDIIANGAKAAAEIGKVNTALKGTADQSAKVTTATKQQSTATQQLTTNWRSALTAVGAVAGAMYSLKRGLDATVGATVAYAKEVRTLSAASGESAENTSRFLQVLDDYQISAGDALTATRALTKQGLAPNIETLAKLSDEYLSLNSAQAKNEFVLKNLGRAGLQWTEVLKQGSAAITAQGAAVNKNLILTAQAVRQAREYELALDELNDSFMGVKITIGGALIPVLDDMLGMINANIKGWTNIIDIWRDPTPRSFSTVLGQIADAAAAAVSPDV